MPRPPFIASVANLEIHHTDSNMNLGKCQMVPAGGELSNEVFAGAGRVGVYLAGAHLWVGSALSWVAAVSAGPERIALRK
jgi:hypothetical protein